MLSAKDENIIRDGPTVWIHSVLSSKVKDLFGFALKRQVDLDRAVPSHHLGRVGGV